MNRSVFDLDNRGSGIHEKLSIDVSQTTGYSLYPNSTHTEINVFCENDGTDPPCDEGVRTVFKGTTRGSGNDNPTDPNNLTEQQMERSVVFTFANTSCWTLEFNAYCTTEPDQKCSWYSGSQFLFSGSASQIVQQGSTECTDEEDERRKLVGSLPNWMSTTNTVQGYGLATLNFDISRRLGTRKKDERRLQGGQGSDIAISIPIVVDDEDDYLLKTAVGSSVYFPCLNFILCLFTIMGIVFAQL